MKKNIALIRQLFAPRWEGSEWLLAQQMLQDIGHILDANAMPWFLAFGTHLGAVRHQGIIPWDDDIDIAIRGEDEQKLLALAPDLKKVGYNIVRVTVTAGPYTEIYYKVWIGSIPSTTSRQYSWPFVDIFVLRPSPDNPDMCGLDHRMFPASYIFPLQKCAFGPFTLSIPNNRDLLGILYEPDYMRTCVSTNYVHRHEYLCDKIIARPTVDVMEAGCFVSIHGMAQKILESIPIHADGWALSPGGDFMCLTRNGVQLRIDHALGAFWSKLDGTRAVSALLDETNGPRIEAMRIVLGSLSALQKNQTIRLTPAKKEGV